MRRRWRESAFTSCGHIAALTFAALCHEREQSQQKSNHSITSLVSASTSMRISRLSALADRDIVGMISAEAVEQTVQR
jgi:hypothetical protein